MALSRVMEELAAATAAEMSRFISTDFALGSSAARLYTHHIAIPPAISTPDSSTLGDFGAALDFYLLQRLGSGFSVSTTMSLDYDRLDAVRARTQVRKLRKTPDELSSGPSTGAEAMLAQRVTLPDMENPRLEALRKLLMQAKASPENHDVSGGLPTNPYTGIPHMPTHTHHPNPPPQPQVTTVAEHRAPWVQHGDFVHPDLYMTKMDGGWIVSVVRRSSHPGIKHTITRHLLAADADTGALTPESAAKLLALLNDTPIDDSLIRF